MSPRVFALSDGNAFYCSCERLFDPSLRSRPVIVLSNNDGCAIARTAEAKALGVKMGDPWHKIRERFEAAGGVARSSNYALYGDISRRLNVVYRQFSPEVEVYSIDESFVDLGHEADPAGAAREMRRTSLQWTGIPTCVGLGPTKTLAKLANWAAKRLPELDGVCDLSNPEVRNAAMATIPAAEVWGVGGASAAKLAAAGVTTAAQLRDLDPRQARAFLTVVGERLIWELRGVSCLPLELEPPPRQGIAVTRCFGRLITKLEEALEAIRTYAARPERSSESTVSPPYTCTWPWRRPSTARSCRSGSTAPPSASSSRRRTLSSWRGPRQPGCGVFGAMAIATIGRA